MIEEVLNPHGVVEFHYKGLVLSRGKSPATIARLRAKFSDPVAVERLYQEECNFRAMKSLVGLAVQVLDVRGISWVPGKKTAIVHTKNIGTLVFTQLRRRELEPFIAALTDVRVFWKPSTDILESLEAEERAAVQRSTPRMRSVQP